MVDYTTVKERVARLIQDSSVEGAGYQNDIEMDNAIRQVITELTSKNRFTWNTKTVVLTHTNGIIALPSDVGVVRHLVDNDSLIKYVNAPASLFVEGQRILNYGQDSQGQLNYAFTGTIMYEIVQNSPTGGTIKLATTTNTPTTRSFTMVYTITLDDFTSLMALVPSIIQARIADYLVYASAVIATSDVNNLNFGNIQLWNQRAQNILETESTLVSDGTPGDITAPRGSPFTNDSSGLSNGFGVAI